MDKKKKSKNTVKKEGKVGSWWKNYCKKHNLNKKDAKYCFISLLFIGYMFIICRNAIFAIRLYQKKAFISAYHIDCLEHQDKTTVAYCRCLAYKFNNKIDFTFFPLSEINKNILKNIEKNIRNSCDYLIKDKIDENRMNYVKKNIKKSFISSCLAKNSTENCNCASKELFSKMTEENWKNIYYCADDTVSQNCVNNIYIIRKYTEEVKNKCKIKNLPQFKEKSLMKIVRF